MSNGSFGRLARKWWLMLAIGIVIGLAAGLPVGGKVVPDAGSQFVGTTVTGGGSSWVLMSDGLGLATGWITLRNDGDKRARLRSYANYWGQWEVDHRGEVWMDPGQTRILISKAIGP